jgi:hypothetical protein
MGGAVAHLPGKLRRGSGHRCSESGRFQESQAPERRQSPSQSKLGFLPHEPRHLGADALHLWLQGRFRVGA